MQGCCETKQAACGLGTWSKGENRTAAYCTPVQNSLLQMISPNLWHMKPPSVVPIVTVYKVASQTLKSHGWQRKENWRRLVGKRGGEESPNYSEPEVPIKMLCLWELLPGYQQGGARRPNRRHFVRSANTSGSQCFQSLASFLCQGLVSSPHWLPCKCQGAPAHTDGQLLLGTGELGKYQRLGRREGHRHMQYFPHLSHIAYPTYFLPLLPKFNGTMRQKKEPSSVSSCILEVIGFMSFRVQS